MRSLLLLLLMALPLRAESREGLGYRIQVWMRGEDQPQETRFWLRGMPVVRTANRVQQPRLGGWRLEAERATSAPSLQIMLLARAERLLYLAGPCPQTRPEPIALRFHGRTLQVHSLEVPRGVRASTVLVEVAPRLLALCDLSVRFDSGDISRVELHLEELAGLSGLGAAESGTALLTTLQDWGRDAASAPAGNP